MKEFKKLLSVLLAFALSFTVLAGMTVTAGAADYTSAKTLEANKAVSISNDKSASASAYFKLVLPDTGKIRFYASSGKTSAKTTFEFLNSKGKSIISGRYSELIAKTRHFNQKGTYYLKLTVLKGQSISKLYYTFIADSGKKVNKSITAEEGKSYDLSAYVKGFGGSVKWSTSDSTVAGISTKGVLTASKSGTAKIYAFSSKGDYAVTAVTIKAEKKTEWLTNYELTSDDISKMTNELRFFLSWHGGFKEGELSESDAIDYIYNVNGSFIDLQGNWSNQNITCISGNPLNEFGGYNAWGVEEKEIDNLIYHLFGIKATHKVSNPRYYYYNGYYYFVDGGAGGGTAVEYISHETMNDGRFLVTVKTETWTGDFDENGNPIPDINILYVLASVHESNGLTYVRIHAVTGTRSEALAGY